MTATPTAPQQFQRAVIGLPFEAVYEWGLDGDAPPDAGVTYTATNSEGAVLASGAATLTTSAPTEASFALTPAELTERDLITVQWSFTVGGAAVIATSNIDVCDRRLFPITDFQQWNDKQTLAASPAQLELARIQAEDFLERECGCAFTGRYSSEQWLLGHNHQWNSGGGFGFDFGPYAGPTHRSVNRNRLMLRRPFVQVIRSIIRTWEDPEAGTSGTHALNLEYVQLDTHTSTIHVRTDPTDQWGGLWGNLQIAFEHGRPWFPDVRRICSILAHYRVLNGPLERRAVSIQTEGGGSIALLTPGMAAAVSGIPEVDTFIQRYNPNADGFMGGVLV